MRIVRGTSSLVAAAVVVVCVFGATPATGQHLLAPAIAEGAMDPTSLRMRSASVPVVSDAAFLPRASAPDDGAAKPRRPGALLPLYGSLIALQGLDIHSTRSALSSPGAREANPAMRPVVDNSAAFLVTKAAATTGVIWASEKLWKKNRKAAVIFTGLVNAAMTAVVAHNYRVAR